MKTTTRHLLVALLGLLLPEAPAAIVYTDTQGRLFELGWPDRTHLYVFDVDVDGDGAYDYYFGGGSISFVFVPVGSNRIQSTKATLPDLGRYPVPLQSGALIGASPSVGTWQGNADAANEADYGHILFTISTGGITSVLPMSEVRYLALEFHREDGIHYGWLALSSGLSTTDAADIYGWAYETEPGKPIAAGAIPEASVMLLGLAAPAVCLRRRRKQPSPNE